MKTSRKKLAVIAALVAVPVAIAFVGYQVQTVGASCSISWDGSQPTCDDELTDREFDFDIGTSWFSQNEGEWELRVDYNYIMSSNIDSGLLTPNSFEVGDNMILSAGDVETSSCSGTLAVNEDEGNFSIFAQNLDTGNCFDSHDVAILEESESCDP